MAVPPPAGFDGTHGKDIERWIAQHYIVIFHGLSSGSSTFQNRSAFVYALQKGIFTAEIAETNSMKDSALSACSAVSSSRAYIREFVAP